MLKTENDTVISVINNLRINSMLMNEYLLFAHFFSFFFISYALFIKQFSQIYLYVFLFSCSCISRFYMISRIHFDEQDDDQFMLYNVMNF